MSYLSVDNIIGVQPTTTSSTNLQAGQLDVYNGPINFHRITSSATSPLIAITIPNVSGTLTVNTATQTLTNKMNHAQVGSATDPSYSFIGNLNLGLFRAAANTIGVTCAGIQRVSVSDTKITSTVQLTLPDGSVGTLSTNFSSASNLGFYNGGVNRLIIVSNGSSAATISNTQFLVNSTQLSVQNGTLATGGLNFSAESGTGLYRAGTGDMRLTASGNESFGVQSQGILLYGSTAGNNALYAASKLSYYEESASFNITWSHGNASSVVVAASCTRIGRIVVFYTNDIIFNTNSTNNPITITSSASIPLRFRPTTTIGFFGAWSNDQAGTYDNWFCFVDGAAGTITMYPRGYGASNAKFWIYGFCGTWII